VSHRASVIVLFVLSAGLLLAALPASAGQSIPTAQIHLRRGVFDPLRATPVTAIDLQASPRSSLQLVQFSAAPGARTPALLEAAGLRPLVYIPDNAFLVRVLVGAPAHAALPGLRWHGPFEPAYKLPAALDQLTRSPDASSSELRVLAAPDADTTALERDLEALGGVVLGRSAGLNGAALHVRLPARALREVVLRDDVLWVEQFGRPTLLNDRARRIVGVNEAWQQLALDGTSQIVAVTDTGLDVQASVQSNANPDFAATRIVHGFSPHDMNSACGPTDWNDQYGHGTHVSGTILGSGARSPAGQSFAGIAPGARLVIESGGPDLTCLDTSNTAYLTNAYDAGARVQNASWGDASVQGGYDGLAQSIDDFLWNHKEHLFVVAAGNNGKDNNHDGVIDQDSIISPATAKNVLSVGATENDRPPTGGCSFGAPENLCWSDYGYKNAPFATNFVSDNIAGMAAFSSRGPADDGRIKPEIVAPGVNIISARSHDPSASYGFTFNADYAYDSGTSMSAPVVSGLAALVRQWLAQDRGIAAPSAALVKALLLNGAADIAPGQYGTGAQREIPAAWPNNVEGWGRAIMTDTVGLGGADRIWLRENAGIQTDGVVSYTVAVSDSQPLRITLAWSDYPAIALVAKTLVNDLDLEVETPDGTFVRGNANAALPSTCRDIAGFDRCDNVESVDIPTPIAGGYIIRVRGAVVPFGPQPFALAARARSISDLQPPGATTLQPIDATGDPALTLNWTGAAGAIRYQVESSDSADFATVLLTQTATATTLTVVEDVGTYFFRVRACNAAGCGPFSAVRSGTVTVPPRKVFLPVINR
jgi:subtilisin family serine protease